MRPAETTRDDGTGVRCADDCEPRDGGIDDGDDCEPRDGGIGARWAEDTGPFGRGVRIDGGANGFERAPRWTR